MPGGPVGAAPAPSRRESEDVATSDTGALALTWHLPGHGDARPTCGEYRTFAHELYLGVSGTHWRRARCRCGSFDCPKCSLEPGGWASREADAILARVSAYFQGRRGRSIHVVVSPPQDCEVDTVGSYRALRRMAYRIARRSGFRGGCLVYHGLRLGSKRFNAGRSLGCRRGPHFHLLGDGWMEPAPKETGWVVKNLGIRKSLRSTAFYLLTHASQGILPMPDLRGPEVVTWFGSMAYNKLRVPETVPEGPYCGVCEENVPRSEWFLVDWVGQGPPPDGDFGVCEYPGWEKAASYWVEPWDGTRMKRSRSRVV